MINFDTLHKGNVLIDAPLQMAAAAAGGCFVDIGGSLRILPDRGDHYESKNAAWGRLIARKTNYIILDPVTTFNPHVCGDVHHLPFQDDSVSAIYCNSVLEHVSNPFQAMSEMYRVLKPKHPLLVFVPFIFPYHPEQGYYSDYWRFTIDGMHEITKPFSKTVIYEQYGRLHTTFYLFPTGLSRILEQFGKLLDFFISERHHRVFTTGYVAICEK